MRNLDTYRYIDACVYQDEFIKRNLKTVLKESQDEQILPILITGASPKSKPRRGYYSALGVSPHHAGKVTKEDIRNLREKADKSIVAIGECGLDFKKIFATRRQQLEIFEEHVKLADEMSLPLMVTFHNSAQDLFKIINKHPNVWERTIITDFDWDPEIIEKLVDRGCYIGINDSVFDFITNPAQIIVLLTIPPEKILFSTRSPFSANYSIREYENCPNNIKFIVESYANALIIDKEDIRKQSLENSKKLFKI